MGRRWYLCHKMLPYPLLGFIITKYSFRDYKPSSKLQDLHGYSTYQVGTRCCVAFHIKANSCRINASKREELRIQDNFATININLIAFHLTHQHTTHLCYNRTGIRPDLYYF